MKIIVTLGDEAVGSTAVVTDHFLWFFKRVTTWICCHFSPIMGGVWINQETSERASGTLTGKLNEAAMARTLHVTAIKATELATAKVSMRKGVVVKLKLAEPVQKIKP